jgi:PPOX class probable F420-dependent enzyme
MTILTPEARALLGSDALAHLVTLNPDGSPQLSCAWVAVDGEEILSGHMQRRQKVRNVERDERVALSIEGQGFNEGGLREYLAVHGRARVQEGGAAALLQELAHVYLGPDAVFPPPGSDAPGYVLRITPERLGAWPRVRGGGS